MYISLNRTSSIKICPLFLAPHHRPVVVLLLSSQIFKQHNLKVGCQIGVRQVEPGGAMYLDEMGQNSSIPPFYLSGNSNAIPFYIHNHNFFILFYFFRHPITANPPCINVTFQSFNFFVMHGLITYLLLRTILPSHGPDIVPTHGNLYFFE